MGIVFSMIDSQLYANGNVIGWGATNGLALNLMEKPPWFREIVHFQFGDFRLGCYLKKMVIMKWWRGAGAAFWAMPQKSSLSQPKIDRLSFDSKIDCVCVCVLLFFSLSIAAPNVLFHVFHSSHICIPYFKWYIFFLFRMRVLTILTCTGHCELCFQSD